MKANGYDRSAGRVNGHATISPSGAAQDTPQLLGRAASDDAREFPNAAAASSPRPERNALRARRWLGPRKVIKSQDPRKKKRKTERKTERKTSPAAAPAGA